MDEAPARGTAVQFGGLKGARSISAHAQLSATAARLRSAGDSTDANEIMAALQAVEVLRPQGVEIPDDIHDLSASIRLRMETDHDLRRQGKLRRSKRVRACVRRLWDLMVAASSDGASPSSEVTRKGYREIHSRVAKSLMEEGDFDEAQAASLAERDWVEDISRFTGTAHITIWLDTIRNRFKASAAEAVAWQGFDALFKRYDEDASGELDHTEFHKAVRTDLGISEATISTQELDTLFAAVDTDGGGSIDTREFLAWLFAPPNKLPARRPAAPGADDSNPKQQARARVENLKVEFKAASADTCQSIGWQHIFSLYRSISTLCSLCSQQPHTIIISSNNVIE